MTDYPKATPEQIKGAKAIRRRRNIGLPLLLPFLPSVAVVHKVTGSDKIAYAVGFLFFITISGLWLSVTFVRCPRCGKTYFSKWYLANGFALDCVHCGL